MSDNPRQAAARVVIRLRRVRELRELSQDELSTKAGLNRSSLAMIEAGKRARGLSLEEALALCRALDVDLCDMLKPEPVLVYTGSEWI